MMRCRQNKMVSVAVLVFFCIFLVDTSISFAKSSPYPKYVKIPFKLDGAKIKIKRINKQIIPVEMKIKNKTFKFVKQDGKYGIRLKTRDMVTLSPEFKDKLGTSVVRLGLYRVKDLVKDDRIKAQEIVNQHKQLKNRSSIKTDVEKRIARLIGAFFSFFTIPEAVAQETVVSETCLKTRSGMVLAAGDTGVDRNFLSQMNNSYNKVLNSQSFVYPQVQPGIGGWDVVSEEGEGNEDEDDEESWYDVLLGFVLVAVVLLAPIAATIWLCAQALTIASVLTAFAGSIGAVTGAGIIAETLGSIGDLLSGKPLIESFDYTTHSSDASYYTEIGPGQWAWP